MTTSLVTGGAGFIGSHVVDHLLKMGHRVIVLDDLSGGTLDNLGANYQFLPQNPIFWYQEPEGVLIDGLFYFCKGSILDAELVNHLVQMWKVDYIFHLAAYAAESLSHYIRKYNYETNVIGSVNLINAAINYGVKRFVFASSAAVLGDHAKGLDERQTPLPCDPYGIAKFTVEMDLKAAALMWGLDYTIFRMHNVYGPRQSLTDGYRNVITTFIRQSLQGQAMTIYGDGSQTRQFTYVDDIAPYIAKCIEYPRSINQIINAGSNSRHEIKMVAKIVATVLNAPFLFQHLPPRREVRHISLRHYKFHNIFHANFNPHNALYDKPEGWLHETDLGVGIALTCKWAKTQTLREPKPFANIEIQKNLPAHWKELNANHR